MWNSPKNVRQFGEPTSRGMLDHCQKSLFAKSPDIKVRDFMANRSHIPAKGAKKLKLKQELQMSPWWHVVLNARFAGRDRKKLNKDRQKRRGRTETIARNYRRHCAIVASRRIPHPRSRIPTSPAVIPAMDHKKGAVVTINAFS